MPSIIQSPQDIHFDIQKLPLNPQPTKVLMVTPTFFHIDNPINVHMLDGLGNKHVLDKNKAQQQWEELKKVYESLGFKVSTLLGVADLPDMVFCANQSFPFVDSNGNHIAYLSNMRNDIREREVSYVDSFFQSEKYSTQNIASRSSKTLFEGMGDALWLGNKRLILGGHGFRTNKHVYDEISRLTGCPVALFELTHAKFYHLDTCLSILNSDTALVCKEAFTIEGYELLKALFANLIEVPLAEADAPGFACNAHCPDGKHVIIQQGNTQTNKLLKQSQFEPIEVDTSEFIKSGGSVFCMKMMYF